MVLVTLCTDLVFFTYGPKHYIGDEDSFQWQKDPCKHWIYRDPQHKWRPNGENGNGHLNTTLKKKGLDNTRKKTSQHVHFAGMEVQDIFDIYIFDIVDPDPAADQEPYAVCIRKLNNHFRVEENIPFERHVFRQLAPTEGEPVDKFVVRLRQQARHCNFGDSLDDNLRDQLIEKLPDMELKKKKNFHRF